MERQLRLQQAEFVALVDKNGNLVSTTRQWPTPKINVSDRPYFQHLKNNNDRGVYISNSLFDRIKGLQVIIFSKRIIDANNVFLGVAVVGVRLTYFQHIYESIASLSDQSFLFLHRDGTVIVRYPDPRIARTRRCRQRHLGTNSSCKGAANIDRRAISTARLDWLPFSRCATIHLWSMSPYQKPRRSRLGVFRQ